MVLHSRWALAVGFKLVCEIVSHGQWFASSITGLKDFFSRYSTKKVFLYKDVLSSSSSFWAIIFTLSEGFDDSIERHATSLQNDIDADLHVFSQVRLYKTLRPSDNQPLTQSSQSSPYATETAAGQAGYAAPHFIVANAMTPSSDANATRDFDSWYQEEHIPLLSRVPGWIASRRFEVVKATDESTCPRFLAIHEWESLSAFDTEEFRHATSTPWRSRVIDKVVKRERLVMRYEGVIDV
jgi:hypothetical protein